MCELTGIAQSNSALLLQVKVGDGHTADMRASKLPEVPQSPEYPHPSEEAHGQPVAKVRTHV